MAETPSTMISLGTELPAFSLADAASGGMVNEKDIIGANATLVMFICNHCPFVKHVFEALDQLGTDYLPKGVGIVAINANDAAKYPQDGPDKMKALVEERGWQFPFLFDETQEVAKTFKAACTPDFFLFDGAAKLVYRGQLDDSRPGNNIPVTGSDLRAALDTVLSGTPIAAPQKPSIGCNIKWRPGNEPEY